MRTHAHTEAHTKWNLTLAKAQTKVSFSRDFRFEKAPKSCSPFIFPPTLYNRFTRRTLEPLFIILDVQSRGQIKGSHAKLTQVSSTTKARQRRGYRIKRTEKRFPIRIIWALLLLPSLYFVFLATSPLKMRRRERQTNVEYRRDAQHGLQITRWSWLQKFTKRLKGVCSILHNTAGSSPKPAKSKKIYHPCSAFKWCFGIGRRNEKGP